MVHIWNYQFIIILLRYNSAQSYVIIYFLSSVEHIKYCEEHFNCLCPYTKKVNGVQSNFNIHCVTKYILCSTEETNSGLERHEVN